MDQHRKIATFNSPLESGVRALALLTSLYPASCDVQRLVYFDYMVVHSGDVGGPESLHPPLPLRTGEVLVRHEIIEKGILLMISRGLIMRIIDEYGIKYQATDAASPFIDALNTSYILKLKERASWVADRFQDSTMEELKGFMRGIINMPTLDLQQAQERQGAKI